MGEIGFGNEEQRRAKPSGTQLIDSIQVKAPTDEEYFFSSEGAGSDELFKDFNMSVLSPIPYSAHFTLCCLAAEINMRHKIL